MPHNILGLGDFKMLDALDAAILKQRAQRDRPEAPISYHPSKASAWIPCTCDGGCDSCAAFGGKGRKVVGECMRASFYRYTGVPPSDPPTPGNILKMETGTLVGQMLGRFAQGLPMISEWALAVQVEGLDRPVSGRVDYAHLHEDGTLGFVELKSTSSRGVKFQVACGIREETKLQVACYNAMQKLLHAGSAFTLADMHVVLFAADTGYRHELVEEVDAESSTSLWDSVVIRWRTLQAFLEERELPPPEYKNAGTGGAWSYWKCRYSETNAKEDGYCGWRRLCRGIPPFDTKEVPNVTTG